jgi:ribosomal protein L37E
MGLTDRQKSTIQSALQKKGFGACPLCRQTNWQLGDDFVHAPVTALGGSVAFGGSHIPMIQIVCTHCGFVSHHAAGVLGIPLE